MRRVRQLTRPPCRARSMNVRVGRERRLVLPPNPGMGYQAAEPRVAAITVRRRRPSRSIGDGQTAVPNPADARHHRASWDLALSHGRGAAPRRPRRTPRPPSSSLEPPLRHDPVSPSASGPRADASPPSAPCRAERRRRAPRRSRALPRGTSGGSAEHREGGVDSRRPRGGASMSPAVPSWRADVYRPGRSWLKRAGEPARRSRPAGSERPDQDSALHQALEVDRPPRARRPPRRATRPRVVRDRLASLGGHDEKVLLVREKSSVPSSASSAADLVRERRLATCSSSAARVKCTVPGNRLEHISSCSSSSDCQSSHAIDLSLDNYVLQRSPGSRQ